MHSSSTACALEEEEAARTPRVEAAGEATRRGLHGRSGPPRTAQAARPPGDERPAADDAGGAPSARGVACARGATRGGQRRRPSDPAKSPAEAARTGGAPRRNRNQARCGLSSSRASVSKPPMRASLSCTRTREGKGQICRFNSGV